MSPDTDALNPTPDLGRLMDVSLRLTVELGQTSLLIRDLLQLQPGSVLALDAVAGEQIGRAHV